jgi:hypothetical protein
MSKRVWEICEPHPDVFSRDPDPSIFAASLYAVKVGTADPDYTDPERFFAKTFMTRSLESVLEGVLARLLGLPGRGAPVLRLETPFGGGKTHTMVALYHLARHAEAVEGTETGERLRERLNMAHLPHDVRVAVLDGVALNPHGWESEGLKIRTLWGELAYQLGGRSLYETLRSADEAKVPPGQAVIAELLRSARPALILMDEVMHFVAKAQAIRVGDTNLSAQTIAFLRELTSAVSEVPQVALILSLPASSLEIPAESSVQAEEMFQSIRKVVGRTELIETPVAQDEVFGVLKRRLFRNAGDERSARRAVEAFRQYYEGYARFFPDRLRSPAYRERMLTAFPFHPELVDLLYQRWGPHPQFQRTRGALHLMALVLRRLWDKRPGSAYLIQPHHIDLTDRHIRANVVKLLDNAFDAIITGDILERAREIDRELGREYLQERLAEGAASCALLYSVSTGMERHGCTEEEMRVALLRPDLNPTQATEVLKRLRDRLWYLRYRDHRYFFTARPNLNKVVLDFEQEISDDQVEESLSEHLRKMAGPAKGELGVILASSDPESISEPSRATLVLLPLSIGGPDEMIQWMKQVVGRVTRRNLLVFLVPEKAREGALRSAVRRWLSLKSLQQAQTFRELEEEDQEEVRRQFKEKEAEVQGLLLGTYTRVYRSSSDGVEELRVTLKRDGKTLTEMVATTLKEKGILMESISLEYLSATFGVGQRPISIAEVQTVLTGSPDQPIVSDPQEALGKAIHEGVQRGRFAVRVGDQTFTADVPDEMFKRSDLVLVPTTTETEGEPSPPPPLLLTTLTVTASGVNLYPLRKVLEQVQGGDKITIRLILEDKSGILTRKRQELEQLLKDYAVPYEWSEDKGEMSTPQGQRGRGEED